MKKWTQADIAQLTELYKTKSYKECAAIMSLSKYSIKAAVTRFGLQSGRTGRFDSGHTPFNNGKKQIEYMSAEAIERTRATQFKKGNVSHNIKHDGAVVKRADGYVYIRQSTNNWVALHRHLWEMEHGPIPEGMVLIFKNGNAEDCSLENLELITRGENAKRNHNTDKARITMLNLFKRERLRKKYGLSPISKHGDRIVNYY